MPPTKTANSTRRTTRTKATTATANPATKPVSKLTHHGLRPSAKQPSRVASSPPTTEDERTHCMRAVNVSLQTLSTVAQSGWRFDPEETKSARNANADARKVDDAVRTAKKALQTLRNIAPDDLDVERAACSISGKLIALALVRAALDF